MIKYKFHTTTYMPELHPEHTKVDSKGFLESLKQLSIIIEHVGFFKHNMIIIKWKHNETSDTYRFEPCDIRLMKYIWDIDKNIRPTIKQQVIRSSHMRLQFMSEKLEDDVMSWYMSIILGKLE